jgi:geranylgeranylglycerol-phosphate geranylgeranyltransferase
MKKLKGLIRLIRFELPFAAGVCVVLGQLFALGEPAAATVMLSAFLSLFFIAASILVLNDYFDVETDRINAPDRPIPAGLVTPPEALGMSTLLVSAGLLLSFFLGVPAFVCAFILLAIGFLYNRRFKKSGLHGNLMVSFSVAMTFVYGGVSVGMPFEKTVWVFAAISGLIDLGEEIAADAMDVEGDRLIRSGSLAIRYGVHAALRISGVIFLTVILLTAIPFISGWFTLAYIFPVAVMDVSIAYSTLRLLQSGKDGGRVYIRRLYLGATAGILIFLIMRLAGV